MNSFQPSPLADARHAIASDARTSMAALGRLPVVAANLPASWEIVRRDGPVLATAIHMGHLIDEELAEHLVASDEELRRDEDPLTGVWAGVGDDIFRTHTSRFEVDLNRPRDKAFSTDPNDTWGIRFYRSRPPEALIERALEQHDRFYAMMRQWIESSILSHGRVLLFDFHSYNHRRGEHAEHGAPQEGNPDIDLGVTTLDASRFGTVVERLQDELRHRPVDGRVLDVRQNVRYEDGGNFPEWVYANYGDDVCTITLEVKKFYMDERTGQASLSIVDDLFHTILEAKRAAARELRACR